MVLAKALTFSGISSPFCIFAAAFGGTASSEGLKATADTAP